MQREGGPVTFTAERERERRGKEGGSGGGREWRREGVGEGEREWGSEGERSSRVCMMLSMQIFDNRIEHVYSMKKPC